VDWLQRLNNFYSFISPILDVALLAFLIYKAYEVLVKTQAVQLFRGLFFVAAVYGAAFIFRLNTLSWILNLIAPGIIIALAILFQPELRKIFMRLGQADWFKAGSKHKSTQLDAVINAAEILSGQRRGALVVFPRKVTLKNIIETGTKLNADISSALIVTIFGHDTPLHDGALVVQDAKIVAAACLLPLSEQQDIRRSFGTRHRAALGLSEESDAVVLVVSEETGAISLAYDSKIYYNLSPHVIRRRLEDLLDYTVEIAEAEEVLVED
jgi:diadenylate cyclase